MPTLKKKTSKRTAKTSKGRKKAPDNLVKPEKDLVASTAANFKKKLAAAVQKGSDELIIDLTGVDQMDCIGLGVTMAAQNSIRRNGGKLTIINASESLSQLFKTLRLDRHFNIQPAG